MLEVHANIKHFLAFFSLKKLSTDQLHPWDNAKKTVNLDKNRYGNIVACMYMLGRFETTLY